MMQGRELFAASLCLSMAIRVGALETPISVEEPVGAARSGEVVSGGIPFPQGAVKDPSAFSLFDGKTEIPVQVSPIVSYPDGSLHWALVSFPVSLAAKENKTLTLRHAAGKARPAHPVVLREDGGRVTLSNGLVDVTFGKESFNGIETLTYKGREIFRAPQAGLTVEGQGGPAKLTHYEARYVGPVRTTVYLKGVYGDRKTPTWSMTVTLCAGESRVHIAHNLRNGGIGVASISPKSAAMRFGVASALTPSEAGGKAPAFGWQRFSGPGDPLFFMRHGGGARSRDIKYSIAAADGEIVVDQSLTGGPIRLSEGTHKITELDIVLGKTMAPEALASPLHARAPSAWYSEHDGMGIGRGFGSIEDETAAYRLAGWAKADEPKKMPNEKPNPALYRSSLDVHGTSEGDQLRGLTVQYVRTGQRGFLDRAMAWNRFFRTRYLWRTDDFTFGKEGRRKVAKWGGDRWCNCHAYGIGLFNVALLTGDIDTLEAAFDAAEHANAVYGTLSKTAPGSNYSWWGSRPFSRLYEIVVRAYDVARTPEWREALVHFVNVSVQSPQRDPRGFINHGVMAAKPQSKLNEFKGEGRRGSPGTVALFEKEGTEILEKGLLRHPTYGEWHAKAVGTWPAAMEAMANFLAARLLADSDDPQARLAAEDAMDFAIAKAYFGARYAFDPVQKCTYYYIFLDFPVPDHIANWKGGQWDAYQAKGTDSWYTKWWPNSIALGYRLTGDPKMLDMTRDVLWWALSRNYVHPPRVPQGEAPPYASISTNMKGDEISTSAFAIGILAKGARKSEPPTAITDVVAKPLGQGRVELSWTEPAGAATRFQVKHADKPIKDYLDVNFREERLTTTYWNMASNVLDEPNPVRPGTRHSMTLEVPTGPRHFAVRSFNAEHSRSPMGAVAFADVK